MPHQGLEKTIHWKVWNTDVEQKTNYHHHSVRLYWAGARPRPEHRPSNTGGSLWCCGPPSPSFRNCCLSFQIETDTEGEKEGKRQTTAALLHYSSCTLQEGPGGLNPGAYTLSVCALYQGSTTCLCLCLSEKSAVSSEVLVIIRQTNKQGEKVLSKRFT